MLVLSFRDMSTPRCSAVTTAAVYRHRPIAPDTDWVPPPPLDLVDWADVHHLVRGRHVCFLIHGFNVDRDRGYTGFGAAAQEMTRNAGALPALAAPAGPVTDLVVRGVDLTIPVLWAGDWYLPVNYPFLLPDIRLTGRRFAELFASSAAGMSRVSFVTHSMGARVMLETIAQTLTLCARCGVRPPRFDTAVLTAAAVSDEVLDNPDYAGAVEALERIVVVTSRGDHVLSLAFPVGDLIEQILWPHDPGADAALGRYGPRLKEGSPALGKTEWYEIPAATDQDHGDYFPAPWADDPPWPNGWSEKRVRIGELSRAVLDAGTPTWPPAKPVTPRPS